MTSDLMVDIQGLEAGYRFKVAVRGLTLRVRRGQSLALLGLNGSGKTTTIRCLIGSLKPKRGVVKVGGFSPGSTAALKLVGFAPEDAFPADFLSAGEYLSFVSGIRRRRGIKVRDEVAGLLRDFELDGTKRIRDFSKGMRRRLLLAQAVVGNPPLLILDEPLNGLDPLVIVKLRQRLNQYVSDGGTLLFSSHILAEVEKTCSDVVLLHDGQGVYQGTISQAIAEFGSLEALFQKKIEGQPS